MVWLLLLRLAEVKRLKNYKPVRWPTVRLGIHSDSHRLRRATLTPQPKGEHVLGQIKSAADCSSSCFYDALFLTGVKRAEQ